MTNEERITELENRAEALADRCLANGEPCSFCSIKVFCTDPKKEKRQIGVMKNDC